MENLPKKTTKLEDLILGIQHVLAMYSGAVLVPLLIGTALRFNAMQMAYLVSADILLTGVATLLQLKRTRFVGIGLPVVLGSAIQSVTPLINIGSSISIGAMYGATIIAGLFMIIIANYFAKLRFLFPPIVTGSLITIIGFTLVPVAIQNWGGGNPQAKSFGKPDNLLIGFITFIVIILLMRFTKKFIKAISILLGIIAGTIFAAIIGDVNLDPVLKASWFHFPMPFFIATPKFDLSAIITMIIIVLTTMIESTGVFFALGDLIHQDITDQDLARGYRAEGLAAILSGIFNTFPYSTFSQNVGVVRLSGVKSKRPIYYAAIVMIIIGFLPKIGALVTIIPMPVLGGAMLVMFSTIGVQGINILKNVDFNDDRNLLIAAISIGSGIGVTVYPQIFQQLPDLVKMVITNAVVITSIVGVSMNALLKLGSKENETT